PQTSCPRGCGGRSPLTACRPRQRSGGAMVRARRLADEDTRTGRLEALCGRAVRRPQDAPRGQALPTVGGAHAAAADVRRLCAARLDSGGGNPRLRLGWPGAHLPRAPRDLVGELGLSLLRAPALCDRRLLHERSLARDPIAR